MPKMAEIRPMPVATRSRGNSSRMMPKQSGKMPPPRPWSTRPATMPPMEVATPERALPAAKMPSETTSIRRLPNMSPRRPKSGVATAAASR